MRPRVVDCPVRETVEQLALIFSQIHTGSKGRRRFSFHQSGYKAPKERIIEGLMHRLVTTPRTQARNCEIAGVQQARLHRLFRCYTGDKLRSHPIPGGTPVAEAILNDPPSEAFGEERRLIGQAAF
jgi:hypothetical protein